MQARAKAKAEKEEAEASSQNLRATVKTRVDEAKDEGFPMGVEEREAYFSEQIMAAEVMSSDRKHTPAASKTIRRRITDETLSCSFQSR